MVKLITDTVLKLMVIYSTFSPLQVRQDLNCQLAVVQIRPQKLKDHKK